MSYESVSCWIREIPKHFKTQEMCNETVAQFSYALRYVPDHLKTQEMCNEAVSNNPAVFLLVPDRFKTQEMCIKALEVDVPDPFKTKEMCDKAVKDDPSSLPFVPDWFVTQQQLDVCMMTIIGITMMRLLSGLTVIKNERLRKKILRKDSCPLLGTPIV